MDNVFCKVRPLVSFVEAANKAILKFEVAFLEEKLKYALLVSGELGTVWLIRTVCGAFQKHGNQVSGMTPYFLAYLNNLTRPLKLSLNNLKAIDLT